MDDDLGLHRRLLPPSSSRADSVALETGGLDGRELTEGISANSPPITESIRVAAGISANSPPVTESITVAAGDSAVTASTAVRPSRGRLACLDVFRGLTIAVMVLVDDAGGEFPHINHAPWNGLHLADFVMPFFLFIVGIAMAFSLKKLADPGRAALRSLERSIKLFLLGVLLQGGYYHDVGKLDFGVDIARLRVCGILQRIALAFLVVSLCEIAHSTRTRHLKLARGQPPAAEEGGVRDSPSETQLQLQIFAQFPLHWACFGVILVLYCALLYGVRVPS